MALTHDELSKTTTCRQGSFRQSCSLLQLEIDSNTLCRHKESLQFHAPQGSSIAFPRLLTKEPIASFCDRVVRESGVFLLSAGAYCHQPSVEAGHFRIGLGRASFKAGLEAFEAYLMEHRNPGAP